MNGKMENGDLTNGEDSGNFDHLDKVNNMEEEARLRFASRVLPENRQERMGILLKNLPNEDLVHIDDSRIPAFLRIDKDVQA